MIVIAVLLVFIWAEKKEKRWMVKFGEWKRIIQAVDFSRGGMVIWKTDVLKPGDNHVDLTYAGGGRLVWAVKIEGGEKIQNQQNSSHNYQSLPVGWINFLEPGRLRVGASCTDGNLEFDGHCTVFQKDAEHFSRLQTIGRDDAIR